MIQIADLLEQNAELSLKDLSLTFGISEPAQLASVEPSRRFFTHLAHNRGDIMLIDLKRIVEQKLRLTRKSIFPYIERAITERRVTFTIESTLGELKESGTSWLYLLENVADKLLENTCQLPSWKDVASYFEYDHIVRESFCANLPVERLTVKLIRYLTFREEVPTIGTFKLHLQRVNRNDIIRLLDGQL